MRPTRLTSCPVNIKPGLTNVLIRKNNFLQVWFCIYKSGYCSFFEELTVFSKLESSMHNRECSASVNLARVEHGESSLNSRLDSRSTILLGSSIECQLTF